MFCAELELQRSKRNDSSGIRKLTSIHFYAYMERIIIIIIIIIIKREHGNCSL